jgi:hypothetical protein
LGTSDSAGDTEGDTDAGPGGKGDDPNGGGDTDGAGATDSDDGVKLDVGTDPTGGELGCVDGQGDCGCTAVDLLFIVDNSLSMEDEQIALGQAFPTFADTILSSLPPGVNVHVGVTSTEMGFSPEGGYDPNNYCIGTGVGGASADNWYQTPDSSPTATNGAQGRLYRAGGMPYFEIDTDAPADEVQALSDWFAAASHIGEGGSNVEMSSAAAAWAMDSAVNTGNAGFIRDEGSVLVLFFVQDEPDQTPTAETQALLGKIAAAKAGCGGWDCVVGGGLINAGCASQTPIGDLFASMPTPPITQQLPLMGVTPDTFEAVLANTLSEVIVDKCGEIEPPG